MVQRKYYPFPPEAFTEGIGTLRTLPPPYCCGVSAIRGHDQGKTFQIFVDTGSSPGRDILDYTTSLGTPQGSVHPASVKCYMFASTEEGGLRVGMDQLAPYQSW